VVNETSRMEGQIYVFELQEGYTVSGAQSVELRVNGVELFFGQVATDPITGFAARITLLVAPELIELKVTFRDPRGDVVSTAAKTLRRKDGAYIGVARTQQGSVVVRQQTQPFLYD
jgi:hypothetical protein